jgi:hypothetical protein
MENSRVLLWRIVVRSARFFCPYQVKMPPNKSLIMTKREGDKDEVE